MPLYTVEYKMVYDMTVEVEADNEYDALDNAYDAALDGEGFEHEVKYQEFGVIRVEDDDEELSEDEIEAQKGDIAYRERRDSQ